MTQPILERARDVGNEDHIGKLLHEFRVAVGELAARVDEMLIRTRGSAPAEVPKDEPQENMSYVSLGQRVRGNLERIRSGLEELEKYV